MKKYFLAILVLLIVGMQSSLAMAEKDEYGFDNHTYYDIFIQSGDGNVSIIKNVEIEGFKEVLGRTFLIVRSSSSFKIKDEDGFILFDAIVAILPDRNFRVEKSSGRRLK